MAKEVGDRVGCILRSSKEAMVVEFLGYGVYEGMCEVNDSPVGQMADMVRESADTYGEAILNPRILLDSGEHVYGLECWWGTEEQIREDLNGFIQRGYTVKDVSIADIREEYRKKVATEKVQSIVDQLLAEDAWGNSNRLNELLQEGRADG